MLQNTLLQGTSKQDLPGLPEALLGTRLVFPAVSEASGLFLKAHPDHEEPPCAECLPALKRHLCELEGGCAGKHTVGMAHPLFS